MLRPWKTIDNPDLLTDLPWLRLSVERVQLPNGYIIDNFYQIHLPEYAIVVAQNQDGMIIMERQYKHATGKVVLDLPAGYLEAKEPPLACAQRELLEETGLKADKWDYLGSFVVDGNRGCGKVHAFIALGVHHVQEPHAEKSENIDVILIDPREA